MNRHLSVHGVSVPTLGLGTWQLRGDAATAAVRHALGVGYRHIDTAQVYGNERDVGLGLKASGVPRDEVFLTTKVWRENLAPEAVRRTTDESLRRLGTDYVDLLLMHWPNSDVPLAETLGALADVRDAGKARLIGVSNTPAGLLREALKTEPTIANDQVEYHVYLGQDRLVEAVREAGLFLTAYSPIARGRVTDDAIIAEIARAHGATPTQVALAWLLAKDRVAAVPKSGTPTHIETNYGAQELNLSADEMATLSGLARGQRLIDPDFAPDWDA